jgi:CheY-like chemotaxis protein
MTDAQGGLLVLVVDDSPDTAGSEAELLSLAGYSVRVALSGQEALTLAAAEQPDVILLDILMPGTDGFEIARQLLAMANGKPPLLVAVTACGADSDYAQTRAAGFDLHLVKPVDPAVLIGLLRRFRRALTRTSAPA